MAEHEFGHRIGCAGSHTSSMTRRRKTAMSRTLGNVDPDGEQSWRCHVGEDEGGRAIDVGDPTSYVAAGRFPHSGMNGGEILAGAV